MDHSYNLYVAVNCCSDRSPLHWLHTIKAYFCWVTAKAHVLVSRQLSSKGSLQEPSSLPYSGSTSSQPPSKVAPRLVPIGATQRGNWKEWQGAFYGPGPQVGLRWPTILWPEPCLWPQLTAEETGKLTTSLYHPLSKYSYERIALPSNFSPKSEFGFGF